tara:strand:+ start:1330 stop:2142 length:813 start_codon:yes stop_codon:yes gene_type:complete
MGSVKDFDYSQITVVVGVDEHTLPMLEVSLPTWLKNRPQMRDMPWLVFYDGLESRPSLEFLHRMPLVNWEALIAYHGSQYETQREKMLSGWVHVPPKYVTTPFWMKIDCDALALEPNEDWLDPEWFEPDGLNRYNCWIASGWNYSKSKGGGGSIWNWADNLEAWGDSFTGLPRLGLRERIVGDKIKYPRMASWLSYYRTDWTKELSKSCSDFCGEGKCVVPSQDTTAWYFSERRQDKVHKAKQKKRGWTNVSRLGNLRERAREIMEETTV